MTDPTETPTGELVAMLERLYALPWGQDWDDKGWPNPGAIAAAARGAPRLVRELREARDLLDWATDGSDASLWNADEMYARARAWLARWRGGE